VPKSSGVHDEGIIRLLLPLAGHPNPSSKSLEYIGKRLYVRTRQHVVEKSAFALSRTVSFGCCTASINLVYCHSPQLHDHPQIFSFSLNVTDLYGEPADPHDDETVPGCIIRLVYALNYIPRDHTPAAAQHITAHVVSS